MTEQAATSFQRSIVSFALLVALALLPGTAAAQTLWNTTTGSWFDAGSWSAGVPTAASVVRINNGGTAQIFLDGALASVLTIGFDTGDSGTLNVFSVLGNAGSLTVSSFLVVGNVGNGAMHLSGTSTVTDAYGVIGTFGTAIGTVDVTGANATWNNTSSLTVIGGTLTISGGGKVNAGSSVIAADSVSRSTTTTVTGSGSAWATSATSTCGTSSGSDVITVADSGLAQVTGQATIDPGCVVNVGAGGAPGTFQAGGIANNGTLHFNHTGASTFSSPLSGSGLVLKDAAGVSTINNAPNFTGTVIVQGGQLVMKSTLGAAAFSAINGATLRFDTATVNLGQSSIRANADSAVEYASGTVKGGFLRGPGTHTLLAGGTNAFNGVTTFTSTDVVQNGTANFTNFTNGGTLTNTAAASLTLDGALNGSSGTLLVNGSLAATDFSSDGVLVVGSGGTLDNGPNDLVTGGGSRSTIDAGGVVFLADGTAWELNGALLVNDGEINGTVDVNFGALAKGGGTFAGAVNVNEGGRFSPGSSPGSATVGSAKFAAGGSYVFELNDASGASGSATDFVAITNGLSFTATETSPFSIAVTSLDSSGQPGPAANFDPSQAHSFTLLTAGGGITGFAPEAFTVDHSAFLNDLAGGTFSVAVSGNSLLLNFTPASVIPTATATAPTPTPTATPSNEAATIGKCRAAITKKSAAFVQTRLAALQQCRTKILTGKFAGICPDDDAKTMQKIAGALQKMRDGIAKACGGKNKTCNLADVGADADLERIAIGFPPICPGFAGGCQNTIADHDCGDIATCVGCIGGAAVDQAIALAYDVAPADPKTAKALNACQRTIGSRAAKLFAAKSKALQSCFDKVRNGKIPGPCPDAAKAEPAIAKATTQFAAAVAKACCGKNKTCALADGGADADFDPVTAIGFPTTCAAVKVPGGSACDATITDMQSLIACVGCVSDVDADCVSAAPFPTVAPYPAECQ